MTWEYKSVPVPCGAEEQIANNMGRDGWELLTMNGPVPMAQSALQTQAHLGWILMFKRPHAKDSIQRNGVLSHASGVPQQD